MPSGVPDFPMPIRAVFEDDGSARTSFLSFVDRMTNDAKRQFQSSFGEINQIISKSVSGFQGGEFKFNFDVSSLRQAAAQADFAVQRLTAMRDAATRLAKSTGDTSAQTTKYIQALQAQVREAEQAQQSANAQVTTYTRLQAEIDKTVAANERLSQSYRETYREQAQQVNAAIAAQDRYNNLISASLGNAAGLGSLGQKATDNGAGFGALEAEIAAQERLNQEKREYADSLELVRRAIDPTRVAQQELDAELLRADAALNRAEISMEEYGLAVNAAANKYQAMVTGQRAGTTARNNIINSLRSERVAFIQLGQQMQDVTVQAQLGTNAFQIFAQQVPQAAFALSGLSDNANKTKARIGAVATFLSGPWGAAIFAATAVLGPFIYKMLESGDAADESSKAQETLAEKVDRTRHSYEEVNKAIIEYASLQKTARENTLLAAAAAAAAANTNIREALSIRKKIQAKLEDQQASFRIGVTGNPELAGGITQGYALQANNLEGQLARNNSELKKLEEAVPEIVGKVATGIAKVNTDPKAKLDLGFEVQRNKAIELGGTVEEVAARLTRINQREAAAQEALRKSQQKDRSSGTGTNKAENEARRLIAFGDKAAESIQRINERFDEQPRLIDQTNRATRELDDIIADLEKRQPPGFEQMITDAERAKTVVADALVQPFRDMEREAFRTVEVNKLVLSGREREAAILEELFRKQDQIGDLTEDQVADVVRIVGAREDELEVMERIAEVQGFYLDATRSVRGEIEAILAGQGKLSNLKQVFQRLQGQVLAEQLFGDVFRDLDKWVKEKTGIGSSVDKLGKEVDRSADIVETFSTVLLRETRRIEQRGALLQPSSTPVDYAQSLQNLLDGTLFIRYPTIDPSKRPRVDNGDGTFSTVETISIATEIGEVLIPTIVDGFRVGADEAIQQFERTGQHLGVFASPQEATTFAKSLSNIQAALPANDNGNGIDPTTGDIVVTAKIDRSGPKTANELTVPEYVRALEDALGKGFDKGLRPLLGDTISQAISPVLAGGITGYATGGAPGGIIGLVKGIEGLPKGITDALGKAGGGAATGSAVAGIAGALGINLSNTGSQIGGAIGSFLPIPGGDIIGAIAGGIIGKLIGGTKRGSATIGGTGSSLSVTGTRGNSSSFINASSTAGGSIIEGVNRIAEAFGASVNAALGSVSIGLRDGKYRVDTSGSGITKTSKGAVDFGKDGAADAIYFATLDLIKDGVIQGLRDGTQRLLQASDDLETGLQKALDFEDVFNQLKAIKDPVGAALDALDKQFSRLDIIFQEAGATAEEYAQLEEYYGIKRNEAIRQAAEQSFGSLKDLLDELNIGDRGLSLSERNANASSQYAELAARVQAGDVTAFNDYAAAASTLLDIRREIFGSQSGYFDTFNSIRDLSQTALDAQQAIADAATNRDSPLSGSSTPANDNAGVADAIAQLGPYIVDGLSAQLSAVNQNLGTIIEQQTTGTTSTTRSNRLYLSEPAA